nr:transposase, mutator type [Tanacetum cinerariifolium]
MKAQWKGNQFKKLVWKCASATTVPYFDRQIEKLKSLDEGAFEYLKKIPHNISQDPISVASSVRGSQASSVDGSKALSVGGSKGLEQVKLEYQVQLKDLWLK